MDAAQQVSFFFCVITCIISLAWILNEIARVRKIVDEIQKDVIAIRLILSQFSVVQQDASVVDDNNIVVYPTSKRKVDLQ